ncbi:unnamed protein product [Cladocopium goreaui]|uniref:Superoxide dismutase copper/zinc binding domain-containing protein n=1 Tax=Cladocopium goreaui TaxID=2562237 RepID=A0A9P1D729_9DINO|nr:unnamed protein product [Cladocopium goreaui]
MGGLLMDPGGSLRPTFWSSVWNYRRRSQQLQQPKVTAGHEQFATLSLRTEVGSCQRAASVLHQAESEVLATASLTKLGDQAQRLPLDLQLFRKNKSRDRIMSSKGDHCYFEIFGPDGEVLVANRFEAYPGYAGSLVVEGTVNVSGATFGIQTVSFSLNGLDAQCGSANHSQPNACGIHVHRGSSCDDAQGHFWDNATVSDPWSLGPTYSGPEVKRLPWPRGWT